MKHRIEDHFFDSFQLENYLFVLILFFLPYNRTLKTLFRSSYMLCILLSKSINIKIETQGTIILSISHFTNFSTNHLRFQTVLQICRNLSSIFVELNFSLFVDSGRD